MNDIVDVLKDAKERIEQGWTKRAYWRSDDAYVAGALSPVTPPPGVKDVRYCAHGALFAAERQREGCIVVVARLLGDVIREQFPDRIVGRRHNSIVAFNDHPDTTHEEVLTVFEKTIVRAEELV